MSYTANIENETLNNDNFRKVLYTGKNMQIVAMSLLPGEEIGSEVHEENDQFFRVEQGEAKVVLNGEKTILKDDEIVIITAGTEHNVINNSETETLKVYTIYAPAEHPDGTVHKTKAEADEYEKLHHGHQD